MTATKEAECCGGCMTLEQLKEFKAFNEDLKKSTEPSARAVFQGKLIRRIVRFAASIAIKQAKANNPNFDEAAAYAAVDAAILEIGDGRIWEWLVNGGFEQILKWVQLIIGLFG